MNTKGTIVAKKRFEKRPLTKARRAAFIAELSIHGIVCQAARVATPWAAGRHGAASTFRQHRDKHPEFALAWEAAQEEADASLLIELRRRAVEGCPVGIFQKGARVIDVDGSPASTIVYSDKLLELLVKSRFPSDFVEKRLIEMTGKVDNAGLTINSSDLLALNAEQQAQLRDILTTIGIHRGEIEQPPFIDGETVR